MVMCWVKHDDMLGANAVTCWVRHKHGDVLGQVQAQ